MVFLALLTAREAARRLGKDERTVRRWIAAGKLPARATTSNHVAIEESDVARLEKSLSFGDKEKQAAGLAERVRRLEQEQARLQARLQDLEARAGAGAGAGGTVSPGPEPAGSQDRVTPTPTATHAPRSPFRARRRSNFEATAPTTITATPTRERAPAATAQELPAGSRRASEFGTAHGVNRVTFRDHLTVGIRGDRLAHLAFPKPDRPREMDRLLTPEQQRAAIAFWERHGTPWQRCEQPDCLICTGPAAGDVIEADVSPAREQDLDAGSQDEQEQGPSEASP